MRSRHLNDVLSTIVVINSIGLTCGPDPVIPAISVIRPIRVIA